MLDDVVLVDVADDGLSVGTETGSPYNDLAPLGAGAEEVVETGAGVEGSLTGVYEGLV